MVASIADRILGLHGWLAIAAVFLLPALESSAFVGFVFPGEIAVLVGGVLAYQHKVSLPVGLAAAIGGAIVGDTIGYEIGKRWGRRMLHGTVGRVVRHEHLDRAEHYLAERGGKAVFFGRFTAALRVLIPGLAGMSGLRYRTFLAYNATGGALWATGFVLAGYVAGGSWRRVERYAGRASLILLVLVGVAAAVTLTGRWISRNQSRLRALLDRQLTRPRVERWRRRYRAQLDFVGRRLKPGEVRGLSLTIAFGLLVLTGWMIGALVQDVVAGDESARVDRPILEWFVRHREPWLTTVMNIATALGSSGVLIPVVIVVGGWWWWRRRSPRPAVLVGGAYLGAEALFRSLKELTGRSRPELSLAVHRFGGLAFPSGHTTLAVAVWGAVAALVAQEARSRRANVAAWTAAVLVAIVVGVSRVYLGAHWPTDVAAGWALGAMWLTVIIVAARQVAAPPDMPANPDP